MRAGGGVGNQECIRIFVLSIIDQRTPEARNQELFINVF